MPTTKGMTGSYNRDSRTQQADFEHFLDALLECIDATAVKGAQQYSIIDYGCSLGANSVLAMNRLIRHLHEHKSIRNFSAFHNDLPTNDFNTLLKKLISSPHDYRHAPGCKVYTQLVPAGKGDGGVISEEDNWGQRTINPDIREKLLSDPLCFLRRRGFPPCRRF